MVQIFYLMCIEIEFGVSCLLFVECECLGICCLLVIIDVGVCVVGVLDEVLIVFGVQLLVFDQMFVNFIEVVVWLVVLVCKVVGCDGFIVIGGGFSMDLVKGVVIVVMYEGLLKCFVIIEGGVGDISLCVLLLIVVLMMVGMGSEVVCGVIFIVDDGCKLGFYNWELLFKVVICDLVFMFKLLFVLIVVMGMDVIVYCIEMFFVLVFNLLVDGIVLEGLCCGWGVIECVMCDGQDCVVCLDMMCVSVYGVMVFQKGLGVVYLLSYFFGGFNLCFYYGMLNVVFLLVVICFNVEVDSVRCEYCIVCLVQVMGLVGDDIDIVVNVIGVMNVQFGLLVGLVVLGVGLELDECIVEYVLLDYCYKINLWLVSFEDYCVLIVVLC